MNTWWIFTNLFISILNIILFRKRIWKNFVYDSEPSSTKLIIEYLLLIMPILNLVILSHYSMKSLFENKNLFQKTKHTKIPDIDTLDVLKKIYKIYKVNLQEDTLKNEENIDSTKFVDNLSELIGKIILGRQREDIKSLLLAYETTLTNVLVILKESKTVSPYVFNELTLEAKKTLELFQSDFLKLEEIKRQCEIKEEEKLSKKIIEEIKMELVYLLKRSSN